MGTWIKRTRHKILNFSEAVGRSFLLNQHAQHCEADYDSAHEALAAWARSFATDEADYRQRD